MALVNDILSKASQTTAKSGDELTLQVDYCLVTDASAHHSLDYFGKNDAPFDAARVAVVLDHDTPSGTEAVSIIQRKLISFARHHKTLFFNGEGIGYQLLMDQQIQTGDVIVGCSRHMSAFGAMGALGLKISPETLAKTIKDGKLTMNVPAIVNVVLTGRLGKGVFAKDAILAIVRQLRTQNLADKIIEFSGDGFEHLTLNDRITLCNLAGESGALTAIVSSEAGLLRDVAACYRFNLAMVSACVAKPDNFEDIVEVGQLQTVAVNEAFIGGCSSGRIEDLRLAAGIVRGRQVARGVRLMIAPATSQDYVQALREGLIEDFVDAGAIVMNQGCSVCWGKSQGIIDTDEVLVSAGSNNCRGCAGAPTAKIYIASAATAAASAITGFITSFVAE